MPIVRLGKLVLRWCTHCNLPILEYKKCGLCGSETKHVQVTPPGDIRPAFEYDLKQARALITQQFGDGTGELVIPPENRIVIFNNAPDIDRMNEVIINGEVIGTLKYELRTRKFRFLPRIRAAQLLAHHLTNGYVIVDKGAVEPILNKANALAPGVIAADEHLQTGDDVIVLDEARTALAVGTAKMTGDEMLKSNRGVAVKVRWAAGSARPPSNEYPHDSGNTWETVVQANQKLLNRKISEAKNFIRKTIDKYNKPPVVSYSGGKDSLATLLLVLEAGIKPRLLFIDTGLEFPETVEHVHKLAANYELELIVESAGEAFWDAVHYFGPPGKDFRWCCKTCKLGPATRAIKRHFKDGVLAFIGQRSYESMARFNSTRVWDNPWVPGQLGASPIQNWCALHVWLYLFQQGADYNLWYERGMERIGCWLCPASDLGDLVLVSEQFPEYARWEQFLTKYAAAKGYTPEWVEYGLWRWKRLPKSMQNLVNDLDLAIKSETHPGDSSKVSAVGINFYTSGSGYIPCETGVSLEGVFDRKLDIVRISNLLNILGKVEHDQTTDSCRIKGLVDVYGEGAVIVKGKTEREVGKFVGQVKSLIIRAIECVGCGVCLGRCKNDALAVLDGQVRVDEDKCIHCGECLGPCPVVDFGVEHGFEF